MERMRQEWAAFQALPLKKKLEHIWIYYKWYLLAGAALICMAVSIAGTVANNRKEILISGIFINNATSQEGYAYLTEGLLEYCGGGDRNVELITGRAIDFNAENPSQEDASAFMIVTCMIAAGTLDYIITDQASVDNFVEQEVVLDLRELLPEQKLAGWDTIEHNGAVTALALEGTAFAADHPLSAPDSCILVVANAPHREGVVKFLDYIKGP